MEKFHGALVAIVTPFIDGQVDEQGFIDLIEFQLENGTHGIVPVGTTGESATLSFDEHKKVVDLTVKTVNGRVPVVAGTGANNTLEAIELSESAKESGADIPMLLYNVPGRTVINIEPATVARLASLDNIIGIKEAAGSLEQMTDVIRSCPDDFIVLSGDDFSAMPSVLVGANGNISVVANVYPEGMAQLMEAALSGDLKKANELHYKMYPLMKLMFAAPSPAPAKKGVELMGKIRSGLPRLPIAPIDDGTLAKLKEVMTGMGLI
ncbi:MAG: 4-hydroxy-tetrahydrodipicolinate synthase [Deltaproteobacteria bacterium]|nr:4-hydroxy-tetrahydrodipicolinate synthase [Deltaproteobacteria bacterium]